MQWVQVTDEDQTNKYKFKRYQGRPFHPAVLGNVGDQLQMFSKLQCREDDVILCTFPKSGTHWVYNTIQMLRSGTLAYFGTPIAACVEDITRIEHMDTPRTFLTHNTFPLIPEEANQGVPKVILVSRNPKDVLVSGYHFLDKMTGTDFQGDFNFFLEYFLSDEFFGLGGSWFTYMKEWENGMKDYPKMRILSIRYEEFKKDTFGTIVKLANFLEVKKDKTFLKEVEENITLDNLKRGHSLMPSEIERWQAFDEHGKLPVYRKGEIGDWKNMFTVAQNEYFNAQYKEKMTGYDLDFEYE